MVFWCFYAVKICIVSPHVYKLRNWKNRNVFLFDLEPLQLERMILLALVAVKEMLLSKGELTILPSIGTCCPLRG